jgi:HTH-type transcriptional regulator/antitoxin HigA
MNIRPIKTEEDYRAALKEVEGLMTAMPDTAEGDRFDVLVTLVEAYESKHYPMDAPDPVEAIKFSMEQSGLTAKDLIKSIGKANRVYEVLNRKRGLTIDMIRKLHENLHIPLRSLIGPAPQKMVMKVAAKSTHAGKGKKSVRIA